MKLKTIAKTVPAAILFLIAILALVGCTANAENSNTETATQTQAEHGTVGFSIPLPEGWDAEEDGTPAIIISETEDGIWACAVKPGESTASYYADGTYIINIVPPFSKGQSALGFPETKELTVNSETKDLITVEFTQATDTSIYERSIAAIAYAADSGGAFYSYADALSYAKKIRDYAIEAGCTSTTNMDKVIQEMENELG